MKILCPKDTMYIFITDIIFKHKLVNYIYFLNTLVNIFSKGI